MGNHNDRIGKQFPAAELLDGDIIDLKELPYFNDLDESTRAVAEFEYAQVTDWEGDGSQVVWETPECVVLYTDCGTYGLGPQTPFTVQARAKR